MSDDDRAGLAAEYVLGTLDADERDEAAALIASDPAFAALVAAWERRLGELHAMVEPVTPPAEIWMALRARLPDPAREAAAPPATAPSELPDTAPGPAQTATAHAESSRAEEIRAGTRESETTHAGATAEPAQPRAPPEPDVPDILRAVAEALAVPPDDSRNAAPSFSAATPAAASGTVSAERIAGDTAGESAAPGAKTTNGSGPDLRAGIGPTAAVDAHDGIDLAVDAEDAIAQPGRDLVLPPPGDDEAVRRLVRSVQRWRSLAAGLAAFAIALAAITVTAAIAPDRLPEPLRLAPQTVEVVREVVRTVEAPAPPPVPANEPARHVAVLQAEGTTPAFLVSLQPDRRSLMVRRVKAADEGDRRYELWLVSDKLSAPRSLGLLGTGEFTIVPAVADLPADLVESAVYAVSLEAETGSPVEGPSGPVLASGRLIEAVPVMPASPPSGSGGP
ncbi:hypothetical protein PQJ75_02500 [Rhodoplanes sp. TEM]|uniref:Anti-sigma K factor RskA C-terminal domain-containing protein n=1 Tax=Rhodoplanes tepidamans TaxID=200616 RepID=A0ABT5J6H3_RHOTP|nr:MULTISPECIES: anti-sigma factor [Rhodoplanes]MDC7785118.1 hypothetical protein [Rhodoplanes tepidamans]MDC7982592.1 hypothetical protein [Rhodoplanes sp. TEM]MDQ0356608.1 anti-sigma-K factor RskA [Rhodoplanes tepidamans]